MNILWLSWKDIDHPQAGGAEVVGHELRKRLFAEGHAVTHLTARYEKSKERDTDYGYETIRVGGRFNVYWKAYRYYRNNLAGSFDIVIDEINTIPFFASLWANRSAGKKRNDEASPRADRYPVVIPAKAGIQKEKTEDPLGEPAQPQFPRTVLFFHQLCREIWFYQMPLPLAIIGYLLEPLYLRLLSRNKHLSTPCDLPLATCDCCRVLTVSQSTKHDLIRYGFARDDIAIISEGIGLRPVDALEPKPDGAPVLLALGSVRPMKRTLHILRAFEIAKAKLPDLVLTIAGDSTGPYGAKVKRAARRSPYCRDIRISGKIGTEEKKQLLRNARLLATTSVKEGWGLVVTEANSQGTPAVAYDADGLRDSIRDGVTGTLARKNNPEGLARAIVGTLADETKYEALRRNAWEWSKQITFAKCYDDFKKATGIRNRPDQNPESLKYLQKR